MLCQNCGKEIPNGADFCTSCGAPVESAGNADAAKANATAEHRSSAETSSELLRLQNDMLRQLINLHTSCDERLRRIKGNTAVIMFIMLLPFILVILGLICNVSIIGMIFSNLR